MVALEKPSRRPQQALWNRNHDDVCASVLEERRKQFPLHSKRSAMKSALIKFVLNYPLRIVGPNNVDCARLAAREKQRHMVHENSLRLSLKASLPALPFSTRRRQKQ